MTRPLLLIWVCLAVSAVTTRTLWADDATRRNEKALPAAAALEGGDRRYKIEFKVVEVQEDSEAGVLAIKVHSVKNPIDKAVFDCLTRQFENENRNKLFRRLSLDMSGHSFSSLQCTRCHAAPQHKDANLYFWKTFLARPHALRTWIGNTKGVKVLASPTLAVVPDVVATINVKSPRKLQYFRREKNGSFALKETEVTTGITIKAAVRETGKQTIRLNPLSVSVAAVKGREPLEGVRLGVGKPILTTTSISTSVVGKLGKSSVISIDSPRGGRVLISVKVSPADKLRVKQPKGKIGSAPRRR